MQPPHCVPSLSTPVDHIRIYIHPLKAHRVQGQAGVTWALLSEVVRLERP